ncbi:Saccharopine dehydrogenase [Coniosporium tulheliwenetii]|uniref:Saccharopine dehydrogenase n=1 Tax=Coniosporium tulheliwenetii TaxID=3383036 RepID=A0ACC2YGS1_9PEZI|nr:Saccharopine dehydrogenase [Cladosporium sp. JES 115]
MAPKTVLHLRAETKPLEHRSALTPTTAKALLDTGDYAINVERTPEKPARIFADSEFADVGCELVPTGSWVDAPHDHIIVGLKELPEDTFPLSHTFVQFAHVFKRQTGWADWLRRWRRGGGTLLDLEFLTDEQGRRVAAFGYHAGFAGAALALKNWAWQLLHPGEEMPGVETFTEGRGYYNNEDELVSQVREDVEKAVQAGHKPPQTIVIGALGRCGRGAVDMLKKAGLEDSQILKWDIQETSAKSGPYAEITESDIFINTIYLMSKIPPFVSMESLREAGEKRRLSVVCDVSCDPNSENNPVPIYSEWTTFEKPTVAVPVEQGPPLSVISIDHLPSLLPREASEAFSSALLPSLMQLKDRKEARVWQEAEKLFHEKVAEVPEEGANGA